MTKPNLFDRILGKSARLAARRHYSHLGIRRGSKSSLHNLSLLSDFGLVEHHQASAPGFQSRVAIATIGEDMTRTNASKRARLRLSAIA
jgi:hypothetical protein